MIKRTIQIIVGNWKSTPKTLAEGIKLVKQVERKLGLSRIKFPKKTYYIAVPEIFVPHLAKVSAKGYVGAQNVHGTEIGQITGATTASQLLTGGAAFTIIGHSEVRARGETVEERRDKVALSLTNSLMTILCFGEHKRDKEGKYLEELENDVKQTLMSTKRELFANLVVAYEPVWAIGGSVPATAQECFEAVIAIRRALASLAGIEYAKKVSILYGGTVNKDNAATFLEEGGVDGLLIGRASQDATTFADIIKACYTK